jgi:hypothetical protein
LWRCAHGTSLLAMVMVYCVGAFFCLLPTELDVPAAPTTTHSITHSPRPDQRSNQEYLAVFQKEAGDKDGRPVNVELLSVLLFVVSFGAIVGWLLAYGRKQRAFRFVGLDHRPSFGTALDFKDRSFLGVFRL